MKKVIIPGWSRKIVFMFILLLLCLAFLSYFILSNSSRLQKTTRELSEKDIGLISILDEVKQTVGLAHIQVMNCLMGESKNIKEININELIKSLDKVNRKLYLFNELVEDQESRNILLSVKQYKEDYVSSGNFLLNKCREGEEITFNDLLAFNLKHNLLRNKLNELSILMISYTISDVNSLEIQIRRETILNTFLILLILTGMIFLAYSIYIIIGEEKSYNNRLIKEIEERKIAEEKLASHAEELEFFNEKKTKLISLISHDLRSPVNSMLGATELLRSNAETLSREEIISLAGITNNSAKKLLDQLTNLLEWIKSQSQKEQFEISEIILFNAAEECIDLLKMAAQNKDISVENNISKHHIVTADKNLLHSIITNLISNSLKFTPRGGKISISSEEKEKMIEVRIKDTGIGMSEEVKSKIFSEEFFSKTGTENEAGSGVGLKLVKEFVEKSGGEISVESEMGKGTIFIFTLPKA